MAEAVFRDVAKKYDLLDSFDVIDSAGTASYHSGDYPDPRTQDICNANNVDISHSARQVSESDFTNFDYILAMDRNNLSNLQRIRPQGSPAKLMMFGDFDDGGKKGTVVEDPYYGGASGFRTNFNQCTRFSKNFMREVLNAEIPHDE